MENNEELPEIQTKLINGVELTNKDIAKISMICDYLVVDHFHDVSSFIRLERCFGPFFTKEAPNFLPEVHKEICGPKKKYITYGRLIAAYAKWKSKSSTNESFNKFMDLVFGDMIKSPEEVVGKLVEGGRIFSTKNTRGRKIISKFSVITDETKDQIRGFHIQYDDFFDTVLSPQKTKENITLEMNFAPNGREIRDRDGISHIGGKYSITKEIIKFLVFKCRSGKTFYIGDISEDEGEQFELFLFGTSSCQLKSVRVEVINNQLTYFEPKFQPSLRVNQKLKDFDSIDDKFLEENITNAPLVFEENEMQNLSDEQLEEGNMLLIPCVSDDAFVDKGTLIEPICGKYFNEICKSFLVSQSEQIEQEKEDLKKKIYEKTIMRKHLLKIYFKKFKITENISILKSPKQPENRIKMDKFLAKVKGYRKKMNKKIEQKKEEAQNTKNEEDSFWNDDEEDWPEDKNLDNNENESNQKEEPKEEQVQKEEEPKKEEPPKEEEPKKEEQTEPKEEEAKKEEPPKIEEVKVEVEPPKMEKDESKEEELKKEEPPKIEEVKVEIEPPKVEQTEEKKEEPPKIDEIKVEVEPPKMEEAKPKEKESKNEEPPKVDEVKVDIEPQKMEEETKKEDIKAEIKNPKVDEIKVESQKEEEIALGEEKLVIEASNEKEKQKEPQDEKIVLKAKPKKLLKKLDKPKINPEEQKQEEPKQEESKKEEIKQEEPKKEEIKQEEPKKEEVKQVEVKKEEPKQEEPKKEEIKQVEVKKEEPKKEEPKPQVIKKVEENKNVINTNENNKINENISNNKGNETNNQNTNENPPTKKRKSLCLCF